MDPLRAFASRPHYLDHIAPVWDALGRPGPVMVDRDIRQHPYAAETGALAVSRGVGAVLVAGYSDLFRARALGFGPFVMMQHGAGQSYHGDPRSAGNQHYAGGKDHGDVALFIVPGEDPAARWRAAYPGARVVVAGMPKPLPSRVGAPGTVVAVTFHWACPLIPETGSAWREFRDALPALADRYEVLGHWHPRWGDVLRTWYEAHGIEPVASLADVARRADVLVADNTSAVYEFAATGRPVALMRSSRWRRDARHGLRFGDASTIGQETAEPHELIPTVATALLDPRGLREERARVVGMVYGPGGAREAAEAIATM